MHLDLIDRRSREEHDFGKAPMKKGAKANASDHFVAALNNGETLRVGVIDQPGNIFPGHLGQLSLEERLESGEDDERAWLLVVLDGHDLDDTIPELAVDSFFGP